MNREEWLNGWPRNEVTVLLGTSVHCAGCGKFYGITCVAFHEAWSPPDKDPDWPFNEDSCPICLLSKSAGSGRKQTLGERLHAFKEAKRQYGLPINEDER